MQAEGYGLSDSEEEIFIDYFPQMLYDESQQPSGYQSSVQGKAALVGELAVPYTCNPL